MRKTRGPLKPVGKRYPSGNLANSSDNLVQLSVAVMPQDGHLNPLISFSLKIFLNTSKNIISNDDHDENENRPKSAMFGLNGAKYVAVPDLPPGSPFFGSRGVPKMAN